MHGAGNDTVMCLNFIRSFIYDNGLRDVGVPPTYPADRRHLFVFACFHHTSLYFSGKVTAKFIPQVGIEGFVFEGMLCKDR